MHRTIKGLRRRITSGASASSQSGSPQQVNASGKPGQAKTLGKPKRTLDIGWATIIGALIAALACIFTFFAGQSTAAKDTSNRPGSQASDSVASASISSSMTGTIPFESTLSGHVENMQPGELLWTFFQVVNRNGSVDSQTFPISGPCTVSFTSNTWICPEVHIGTEDDKETYRVCVAVLNFSEAHMVTELLENTYETDHKFYTYWFNSPPAYIHDHSQACMSATRTD